MARDKTLQRERLRRVQAEARERNALIVRGAKAVPCVDCEQEYPHYVMDFDHVRGEKVASVTKLAMKHVTIERLLAEIEKCDVVCANCHRERTHTRWLARQATE